MNIKRNYRHDPLYRIIDITEEMRKIEGKYSDYFDRLKKINNLGLIPEVIEMAKYSKYEHTLGTIHQVNNLLNLAKIEKKYHQPLKIAAQFLHLGHFPFTYSTERAIILASNIEESDNRIRNYLKEIIESVLTKQEYEKEKSEAIINDILSLKNPTIFYRYLSSKIFLKHWRQLKKEFPEDQKFIQKTVISNLINEENPGFLYLEFADQADYVQRDALYLGAIKLDFSPKHLYFNLSEGYPFDTEETDLLDANLNYLTNKFYKDDQVIRFSSFYEKIVAALILDENFDLNWLNNYNDETFRWLITENKKSNNINAKLPKKWIKRAKELFTGYYRYENLFFFDLVQIDPTLTPIEFENQLIKNGDERTNILEYPFNKGYLLAIDLNEDLNMFLQQLNLSMWVFKDPGNKDLSPILHLIFKLSKHMSFSNIEIVRKGLGDDISWTGNCRINNNMVAQSIAKAILKLESEEEKGNFVSNLVDAIASVEGFEELWVSQEIKWWKLMIIDQLKEAFNRPEFPELEAYRDIASQLLAFPVELIQSKSVNPYYLKIKNQLLKDIQDTKEKDRGSIFEAICYIEKLLEKNGKFQFFINGCIIKDHEEIPSKQDKNEFDILEFRINDSGKSELWIYACSISDDIEQKNLDQISSLVDHLGHKYSDQIIRSKYLVPKTRSNKIVGVKEEDTGRNKIID